MQTEWLMPKPNMGDVVLFSTDRVTFSNPCIGWVIKPPGDSTLQILTFTPTNGWIERPSVHHFNDPALSSENGWESLGVWDFTDTTKAALKHQPRASEVRSVARETAAK